MYQRKHIKQTAYISYFNFLSELSKWLLDWPIDLIHKKGLDDY